MHKNRFSKLILIICIGLCAVILFSNPVSAKYKELMHEETHRHEDNFTLDGRLFTVKAGGTETKVILSIGNEVVVIENNTCIDKMNMSLCLTNIKNDDLGLHKIFDPKDFEFDIEVWYYLANLAIEKEIEKTEFLVGEKVKVEIVLQNNGSLAARGIYFRDIQFSESYPDFFISNVVGCSYNKHNISWEGILKPTQKKICTYYIEAIRTTTFSSVAKATYLVGILNKTRDVESEKITITVPKAELDFNKSINQTELWVGDSFEYNFTIKNNIENHRFDNIALNIDPSEGIDFTEISEEFSATGKQLRWIGSLDYLDNKSFYLKGRIIKSGNLTLNTNVNYNTDHIIHIEDWYDNITSNIDKLEIQYISMPEKRNSGKNIRIAINLKNPSSEYVFNNIKGNITTNLPTSFNSFNFIEIGKNRFREIISQNITTPYVNEQTGYSINFNVEYETKYGEIINLQEKKMIQIFPKNYIEPKPKIDTSNALVEKIDEIGLKKVLLWSSIFLAMFLISISYFLRKVFKKVNDYEKFE